VRVRSGKNSRHGFWRCGSSAQLGDPTLDALPI
jgi:hypothetical protein